MIHIYHFEPYAIPQGVNQKCRVTSLSSYIWTLDWFTSEPPSREDNSLDSETMLTGW